MKEIKKRNGEICMSEKIIGYAGNTGCHHYTTSSRFRIISE